MKIDMAKLKAIMKGEETNEILNVVRSYKNIFYILLVFTAIINFIMIVPALYMFQVYDSVLSSRSFETLLMLTLIAVFMYAVFGFLSWTRSQILVRINNDIDQKLSNKNIFFCSIRCHSNRLNKSFTGFYRPYQSEAVHNRSRIFAFFDAPFGLIF